MTGPEMPLSPEQVLQDTPAALLLLDVENRFFWQSRGGPPLPAAAILGNLTRVLEAARGRGVLRSFVVTALDSQVDSDVWRRRRAFFRVNQPSLAQHSTWGSSLADPFQPQPTEVQISKVRMSAFHGTSLETYLRSAGVKAVVLVGVATNGAILATALDALSRDFYAFTVRDAVFGTAPELHDAALTILGEGNLIDTHTLCQVWEG